MVWTTKEVEFLKREYSVMNTQEIAKELNRTVTTIRLMAYRLQLKKVRSRKWAPEEIEFLKREYNRMTNKEIGKKLNRTTGAIFAMAKKLQIKKQVVNK